MTPIDAVLQERGSTATFDAFVVAVAFAGGHPAFALGDGSLRILRDDVWQSVEAHDGAILAMAPAGPAWITAGDDGALRRTDLDGTSSDIARFGSKWVEQVACHTGDLVACGVGKSVHVFDRAGSKLKELNHPSTVTGIAFDGKGKRIAASHYNGASVWFVASKEATPRKLEWKGSHTGIAVHPTAEAVVTSMQESALHGWRLADGQHMRMSGYPSKTESLSFSRTGKWLASSGAESIVLWPFFGGGPMGKAPTELAGGDRILCTRVAFHPKEDMVAAGFSDGLLVVADVATERVLPVSPPGHGPISTLAWSPDGSHLAFGTETGFAAVVDLSKR